MLDFSHLILKPSEIDMVLYHGDCVDGYACAFICNLFFKNKSKRITYIPCQYQKPPPLVSNKNVLICDFSYKNQVLHNMIKQANKLCILDHHTSSERDLNNIPNQNKVFNITHSAAYITWCYFFGENKVPLMIKYIEDNDIGRWALPNTKSFSSYIFNLPKKSESYSPLLDDSYVINTVLPMGEGMQKQNLSYINDGVKRACAYFMLINNYVYFVIHINTSILKSEIANAVFDIYPNANFAFCWSHNSYTNEIYASLRSIQNGTDVEKIAALFGGGGHSRAAGLTLYNTNCIPGIILDRHQCYNMLERINIISQVIMSDFDVNIVYLNSSHHKRYFGKYLLQIRYVEQTTNKDISEACSIIRNRDKDPTYYIGIDLACIYYFDDHENATYFSIISNDLELLTMMSDYYKKFVTDTDDMNIVHRLKLKFNGLLSKIPVKC